MATRGVFQLQKLRLYYCEHGGSSRAIRDYLASGQLVDWACEHPNVEIIVQLRNGHHPFLRGEYKTQAAAHQICVKNAAAPQVIQDTVEKLHNRSGRKIKKLTKPVYSTTPSIQGVWTPFLGLRTESFPIQFVNGDTAA